MIKITNNTGIGRKVLTVTQGAYENIYRKLGYVPFKTADGDTGTGASANTGKTEEELFRESVEAKPIGQWSNAELKRYAVLVGIDPKLKAADLKEAIKEKIADGGRQTAVEKTEEDNDDGTD